MMPTVFIVDDDESFLRAVSRLLRASGFAVQQFTSARTFLAHLDPAVPGCLVVDLRMPEMDGLQLQAVLAQTQNVLPVIFLTSKGDIPSTVAAMRNGAEDFLEKSAPREQILDAVRRALARDAHAREDRERTSRARALLEQLTLREREVLAFLLRGALNKVIAAELGISVRTVKMHRHHITTKLGVPSVAEMAGLTQTAGFSPCGPCPWVQ